MSAMYISLALCLGLMGLLFLALYIAFRVKKEKACRLIAGFNFFTEAQQAEYDKKRIARDQQKQYGLLSLAAFLGAGLSLPFGWWAFGGTLAAVLIILFRDFHIFADKAFEKYKL